MPLYDIPSEAEITNIRSQWSRNSEDGSTIHRLCDALELLKKELEIDDRHTIPTPPPEDDDLLPNPTVLGVAPPPALFSRKHAEHRCAACLDEFTPAVLPPTCPSCRSQDVFPTDHESWPCGGCGKMKDGLDPCTCSPLDVLIEVEEEDIKQNVFTGDLRRM